MCAEHARDTNLDAVGQRLQDAVGERPAVTAEEHQSLMAAVRNPKKFRTVRCRPLSFSSSFGTRLKIAAGLALCGLLAALFVHSQRRAELAQPGDLAPVGETLAVAEALPEYAQSAAVRLEAIPGDEWARIQQDGEAVYGHVLRCITQFGG